MIDKKLFIKSALVRGLRDPRLYLNKLIKNVLLVGLATFLLDYLYINIIGGKPEGMVPVSIYSLIGFVIALALAFRMNTAYERWYEGRKRINSIETIYNKLKILGDRIAIYRGKNIIRDILRALLCTDDEKLRNIIGDMNEQASVNKGDLSKDNMDLLLKLIEDFHMCQMIKNTPIPLGYAAHIKVCILLYVMSLPFTSLSSMGLYSVILVMLLYFLIAGIEIVSNEIEDPFAGDPNDLPVEELFNDILQ